MKVITERHNGTSCRHYSRGEGHREIPEADGGDDGDLDAEPG
jgi:hypothetical protein